MSALSTRYRELSISKLARSTKNGGGIAIRGAKTPINASSSGGGARQKICRKLVEKLGGTYTSALGISLTGMESDEVSKWFLTSLLLGARNSESTALRTYKEFKKAGVLSPDAILQTGVPGLVDILGRGGYVRYDLRMATKLLLASGGLMDKYEGDLNRLHFFARDEKDLENRLKGLGKGIGPATVRLFLMELRDLWEKAEPPLAEPAITASRNLGLTRATDSRAGLEQLKAMWEVDGRCQYRLSDLEAALMRLGKKYCRRKRCSTCPVKTDCQNPK